MHGLSGTTGVVAVAAAAVAVASLVLTLGLFLQLRRVRGDQRVILGDGEQDLVAHATGLADEFDVLTQYVRAAVGSLQERADEVDGRVDHAIAYRAVVRYDAYGEMSGQQSASIALLDATGSGVVLSSIHHRDQARIYTKAIRRGVPELQLSPEEEEAIRVALAGDGAEVPGASAR